MTAHSRIAAPALADWLDHDGRAPGARRCPLDYSTVVQVRFKSGLESDPSFAGFWGAHGATSAWDRRHRDPIVAYRLCRFEDKAAIVAERRATIAAARELNLPARIDALAEKRRAA